MNEINKELSYMIFRLTVMKKRMDDYEAEIQAWLAENKDTMSCAFHAIHNSAHNLRKQIEDLESQITQMRDSEQ
jgi:dsDNA-binding SOS-regulon protein